MRYFMMLLSLMFLVTATTTAETYTVERAVISATGGTVFGGPFQLNFTVGQSVVGTQSSTDQRLNSGFWWEVSTAPVGIQTDPLPTRFALDPNQPNPFATLTTVRYAIPAGSDVPIFLGVYDLNGRLVRELVRNRQSPGQYSITWNGTDDDGRLLSAGVYFVRFQAPNILQHRRIVMLR